MDEAVKFVRSRLRKKFPGAKFSTTKDGNTINVKWTDGPAYKEVDALVGMCHSLYFEMLDDSVRPFKAVVDGEEINFGNGYIYLRRDLSDEFYAAMKGRD